MRRTVSARHLAHWLLPLLVLVSTAPAEVIHVPQDYGTIQEALDAAADGDEVVVASGTYTSLAVFPARSITLRSESGDPHTTILDGSAYTDEAFLTLEGSVQGVRSVEGFTIQNAPRALTTSHLDDAGTTRLRGNRFVSNGPWWCVRLQGANSEVTDNEFVDNESRVWAGGLFVARSGVIRGNVFRNNRANPFSSLDYSLGGAIYLGGMGFEGLTMEIRENVFEGNSCTDCGGAIEAGTFRGSVVIEGNEFRGNACDIFGGAIGQFGSYPTLTIEDNLFVDNEAPAGAGIGVNGISAPTIVGNTIVGSRNGSGIILQFVPAAIIHRNLVVFGEGGGILWENAFGLEITCNDSHGNAGPNYTELLDDNFSEDPMFCGREVDDYTVGPTSICLPASNSCQVQIGLYGEGCPTPVVTATWSGIKARYRGPEARGAR